MSKELDLKDLETTETVETTATDKAAAKREKALENQPLVVAGLDKIVAFGASEKLQAVIACAKEWNVAEKEDLAVAKEAMFEALGGQEAGKEYLTGDFQTEIEGLRGIVPGISVLNTIYHFYKPRKSTAGSGNSKKTVLVKIEGTQYEIPENIYQEGANMTRDEKIAHFLAEGNGAVKINEVEEL